MTRGEAVEQLRNLKKANFFSSTIIALDMAIEALSADAIEVVRCKDCKHRYGDECPMRYVEWVTYEDDGFIESDDIVHDHTMDDGFCNCGEREDGEEE